MKTSDERFLEKQLDAAMKEIDLLRAINAELVSALKSIIDLDDGDKPDLWHYQTEFDAARAAIAKATS